MSVKEEKKLFVKNELQSLMKKIDKDILKVYYYTDNEEEYVYVIYNNSNQLKICVTADSFVALTIDVLYRVR